MNVTGAISVARLTDAGLLRECNEDSVASDLTTGLIMVADGMGGHRGGAIASEIATIVIASEFAEMLLQQSSKKRNTLIPAILRKAVAKANTAILNVSKKDTLFEGMGTTLVVGVFADNKIITGHIGDSRLYRLRGDELEQLTEDHSLLQEQINAGLITKEQAKLSNNGHLVTRALGTDPKVELEISEYPTEVGDFYLLCSDGLTDLVDDSEIRQTMLNTTENINHMALNLVELANKHGGNDNVSVVIAFVKESFAIKRGWIRRLLG